MSQREEVMARIRELKLVAVVRSSPQQVEPVVLALLQGGVSAIEVTFTVPNAVELIWQTNARFHGRVLLGAGTVVDAEKAAAAIDAGARYIVAPNLNPDVIRLCAERDIAVIPGAYTPSEVYNAWAAGADCVKLFPAAIGGIDLLRALRAPYPDIPIMPTGGVDVSNAGDWIRAGAVALGVGSKLVRKDALAKGEYSLITETARRFVTAIAKAKE
jgi:2-dehydro-3-deoxyphosphogluconate aldolase/(4S)-4-hydroxy-2-oxoglutarate aldolase